MFKPPPPPIWEKHPDWNTHNDFFLLCCYFASFCISLWLYCASVFVFQNYVFILSVFLHYFVVVLCLFVFSMHLHKGWPIRFQEGLCRPHLRLREETFTARLSSIHSLPFGLIIVLRSVWRWLYLQRPCTLPVFSYFAVFRSSGCVAPRQKQCTKAAGGTLRTIFKCCVYKPQLIKPTQDVNSCHLKCWQTEIGEWGALKQGL